MTIDTILEIVGFVIGIVYLYWEYQADVKVWLASVVMPMVSMWVYFENGLYADFAINIYYLVIAVYGYISWTCKGKKTAGEAGECTELPITRVPLRVCLGAVTTMAGLWLAIWLILKYFTDSTVPVADAFTTALSIVGLWMLARKYAEVWLVWFVVNIVSSALYLYKGLPFYCALYVIYTVVSLMGYRKWLRMMRLQQSDKSGAQTR